MGVAWPHEWARNIGDLCQRRGIAFFFKQSAAFRTEMGTTLDGRQYRGVSRASPSSLIVSPERSRRFPFFSR